MGGPHDGERMHVSYAVPVVRVPAPPELTPPAPGRLSDADPEPARGVYLYVRTVARCFDGSPRYLYVGIEPKRHA